MTKPRRKTSKASRSVLPGTDIDLPEDLVPLLVPIGAVYEDPANPRITRNLGALVAKFKRFGFTDPIGVNVSGMVEAGHQRLYACRDIGATHIPRVRLDHSEIDALAFNIAHNRANEEVAEWDRDALAPLLAKLKAEDALEAVGWDGDELEALLANLDPPPDVITETAEAEDEDEPKLQECRLRERHGRRADDRPLRPRYPRREALRGLRNRAQARH